MAQLHSHRRQQGRASVNGLFAPPHRDGTAKGAIDLRWTYTPGGSGMGIRSASLYGYEENCTQDGMGKGRH